MLISMFVMDGPIYRAQQSCTETQCLHDEFWLQRFPIGLAYTHAICFVIFTLPAYFNYFFLLFIPTEKTQKLLPYDFM